MTASPDCCSSSLRLRTVPMVPRFLIARLDTYLRNQLEGGEGMPAFDFGNPLGEAALAGPDSVSWRVFRNPVSLFIGGISAVLMELAEPRVRSGVWDHTTFRTDPLKRMRRTGLAAMVTVYGARSAAEKMIAQVGRMHGKISGTTPAGEVYRADDPQLLRWVHATALYGFMEAYHRFVAPLSSEDRDRFVAEGTAAALLYGALEPPESEGDLWQLFRQMEALLEPSEIVTEFLQMIVELQFLPVKIRPLNELLVRAAVEILPPAIRKILGLGNRFSLPLGGARCLLFCGARMDRLPLESSPAARACIRMQLPGDYLLPQKKARRDEAEKMAAKS